MPGLRRSTALFPLLLLLALLAVHGTLASAAVPKVSYTICVEGPVEVSLPGARPVVVNARVCASVNYYEGRGPSAALISLSPAGLPASAVNKLLNDALTVFSRVFSGIQPVAPAGERFVYVAGEGPVACSDTYTGAGEGVVEALLIRTVDGGFIPARIVVKSDGLTIEATLTYLEEAVCGEPVLTPAYRAGLAGLVLLVLGGSLAAVYWRVKHFTLRPHGLFGEIG